MLDTMKDTTEATEGIPRIITDPQVDPSTQSPERRGTQTMLRTLYPDTKLHHLSRSDIYLPGNRKATSSLFFWTAHHCFARHLPLALDPTVLWYVILHEVATAVKLDPQSWAHLFTRKPDEKQIVRVIDNNLVYPAPPGRNDWGTSIGLFDTELTQFIPNPETMNTMLPKFSTGSPETQVAQLVAFMDAASPYFDYRVMTICGIPAVRMDGTEKDWNRLLARARALCLLVPDGEAGAHMTLYFKHLLPTLERLAAARAGETDLAFWRDLYKLDDMSGGPYAQGWLTKFLAFVNAPGESKDPNDPLKLGPGVLVPKHEAMFDFEGHGGIGTDKFPSHVSNVPFLWEYFGQEIPMQFVAGVLGVDVDDGFLAPRLGFGVLEPVA